MTSKILRIAFVWLLFATAAAADATPPLVFPKAVTVRAFLFEPHADGNSISSDLRAVNSTAVPRAGIRLSAQQINQLRRALVPRPQPPQYPVAACFSPRHGFIFEDAEGKVVGIVDACFECRGVSYDAPGFQARVKPIYDRFPRTNTAADQQLQIKLDAEVEQVRSEFGIPPSQEVVDWGALGKLVSALGLPAEPKPADYQRLGAKAAP